MTAIKPAVAGAPLARRALALIAAAQLLALSLWFSASAVAPGLATDWALRPSAVPWLTLSVQLGFVVGAVGSSILGLADRIPARRLFAVSAVTGAVLNAFLVELGAGDAALAFLLRFLTGVTLAGVYPSGMKAVAGWFRQGRGTALGILIGALTVGSALPHLVRGIGLPWQGVILGSSVMALAGAGLMMAAGDGPHETPISRFSWRHLRRIGGNRGFRLATTGYLGHMWELYAAWTWVAIYLAAGGLDRSASTITFFVIAAGGVGAWLAGRIADRRGRTIAAGGSMVASGTAAAATAVVFGAPAWIVIPVLLIWGFTVVSDSAQFSAMVTEVVDDDVRGTALTVQTALGFTLTLASIWLVPAVAAATSWRWAFLVLVPGPIIGTIAMVTLRRSPWAMQIAGGRG